MTRLARLLIIALTLGVPCFMPWASAVQAAGSSSSAATRGGVNGGYPRLANYNGYVAAGQAPFYAGYNLIIARRGAPIGQLQQANPRAVTLLYERTLQADLCCTSTLYGMDPGQVPPRWWLLAGGSRLASAIDAGQDWITVADPRPFARCQDVLVDGESMHVWSVQGHRLNVLRGYYSNPTRHRAGALIAPHISYRIDLSNCTLTGPGTSVRPWSLNLSSRCPRWHGQTWGDYLAHWVAGIIQREGWSGAFFDNLNDLPFSPLVDTDGNGRADGGIIKGVNVWEAGARALLAETQRLLPHHPILVNGDLRIAGLANGREMEGFPTIPGLPLSAAIDSYLADAELGTPRTIVNPDTQGRPIPSPAVGELAVGVSLLGDGYATYDRGWQDHGDPWWFDAYAQNAGARLQLPVGPWTAQLLVTQPWQFAVGETVLLDQEAAVVTGITPHSVLVERGMDATAAASHDAGTPVSTAWQRLHGHGYLGLPRGSARLVPTGPMARYALPLTLTAARGVRGARLGPLASHNLLAIRSTVHYDPTATGLTLSVPVAGPALRTLVFDARGPAGAQLWITAGMTSVPLVLRKGWHHYVLPVAQADTITLGTGRVRGRVTVRDLRLYGAQALVWRRDFTHGSVLVNATDHIQRVALEHPFLALEATSQPGAARGSLTCAVTLTHYQAAILLDGPPNARCASAATHTTRTRRPPTAHAQPAPPVYVVTTVDALHLRQGPSLSAPIVSTLPLGTRLACHSYSGEWVAVTTSDGTAGFVLRAYVAVVP